MLHFMICMCYRKTELDITSKGKQPSSLLQLILPNRINRYHLNVTFHIFSCICFPTELTKFYHCTISDLHKFTLPWHSNCACGKLLGSLILYREIIWYLFWICRFFIIKCIIVFRISGNVRSFFQETNVKQVVFKLIFNLQSLNKKWRLNSCVICLRE